MKKEVASFSVPYLQVLDEKGKVDKKLEPKLTKEQLLKMYSDMVTARLFDEKCLKLQRQGRMGTFAPVTGQEAAQVGSAFALDKEDWLVPSFREAAAAITRGAPLSLLALYVMGHPKGGSVPEGGHDLPVSIPVGSQILHAAGIGMALSIQQKKACALVYFGDGATSEGDFHEGLNFAGVFLAPTIFVCQNNQYAISLPRSQQTHSQTIAQKGIAYGIDCIQVDGNDVLGMYVATLEAAKRAKAGKGPTLIEAVTYRMMMHTTADDPTRYRTDKEVNSWKKKDPITRFKTYLEHKKVLTAAKDKKIREEATALIEEQMKLAEQEPVSIEDMFSHLFAELTPQLTEQLEIAKSYGGGRS